MSFRAEADNPDIGFAAARTLLQPGSAVHVEESHKPAGCKGLVAAQGAAEELEDHNQQRVERHTHWERKQSAGNQAVRTGASMPGTERQQNRERTEAAAVVDTMCPELVAGCGTAVDRTAAHTEQMDTQDLVDQRTAGHTHTQAVHILVRRVHCERSPG